jgi:hypothetical protein
MYPQFIQSTVPQINQLIQDLITKYGSDLQIGADDIAVGEDGLVTVCYWLELPEEK